MINITIIGKMGEGKTTFIKQFINGRRAFLFDVNNEYKGISTDTRKTVSRMADLNHKEFIKKTLEKRNTCCVYEDATGFIEGRLSDDFRKTLVSKRHTGNTNILVFHSILSVPPRLVQLTDIIVLFKTGDEDYMVERKYPSLLKLFRFLNRQAIPKYCYVLYNLSNGAVSLVAPHKQLQK